MENLMEVVMAVSEQQDLTSCRCLSSSRSPPRRSVVTVTCRSAFDSSDAC
jgi:hypothetical protein